MPKGANQKLKLIYLIKIMLEKTDEEHGLTRPEIESALEAYGVTVERKSIQVHYRKEVEAIDKETGKSCKQS